MCKGREEKEVASLLDRAKNPTPADIARPRKIRKTRPPRESDNAHDPLEWWKTNSSALPCWFLAAQRTFLDQPPSAAAERVFSLPKSSFGDQQDNSLKESSLMLQYHKR